MFVDIPPGGSNRLGLPPAAARFAPWRLDTSASRVASTESAAVSTPPLEGSNEANRLSACPHGHWCLPRVGRQLNQPPHFGAGRRAAATRARGKADHRPAAAATTAPAAAATAPPAGRRGDHGARRQPATGGWRRRHAQAAVLAGPHDPEHAPRQGTKDYLSGALCSSRCAAAGPTASSSPLLAAEVPTVENGGVPGRQDRHLEAQARASSGPTARRSPPTTSSSPTSTWPIEDRLDRPAGSPTASTRSRPGPADGQGDLQGPESVPYQLFVSATTAYLQKQQFKDFMGAKAKDAPGNLKPIGTGPYMVTDFKPGDVVTYEINDLLPRPGQAVLQGGRAQGRRRRDLGGARRLPDRRVDYAWNLQVEAQVLNQLLAGRQGRARHRPGPTSSDPDQLRRPEQGSRRRPRRAGTKHPFLSDLNVRQAFAMAVDRKSMAEQLYGPAGEATCNIVTAPRRLRLEEHRQHGRVQVRHAAATSCSTRPAGRRARTASAPKDGVKMKVALPDHDQPAAPERAGDRQGRLGAARRRGRAQVDRRRRVLLQRRWQPGHRRPLLRRRRDVHQRCRARPTTRITWRCWTSTDRPEGERVAWQQLPAAGPARTTTQI